MIPTNLFTGNQFTSGGLVLMATGAIMGLLRNLPNNVYHWIKKRLTVHVTIVDGDPLFEWTTLWLDSLPYARKTRRLSVALHHDVEEDYSTDSKLIFTPAVGSHMYRHNGRLVWLERTQPDDTKTPSGSTTAGVRRQGLETITITMLGFRQAPIRDLVSEITAFATKAFEQRPRGYISARGWWNRLRSFQPRLLSTVDVPTTDERRIVGAISEFLVSRELYAKRGIPYHLNLLFAGLPGTGKTSLASALCGHFGLHLYLLNIAGPSMNDDKLVDLMLSLPRRSMVLMEDVDAVVPERTAKPVATPAADEDEDDDDKQKRGITLSGLLNCMDGLTAPDGVVIVMTTNHPELLDPALLRPGRVDLRVEFGTATQEQIERMCARLCPGRHTNGEVAGMLAKGLTTAQVQAELLAGWPRE